MNLPRALSLVSDGVGTVARFHFFTAAFVFLGVYLRVVFPDGLKSRPGHHWHPRQHLAWTGSPEMVE